MAPRRRSPPTTTSRATSAATNSLGRDKSPPALSVRAAVDHDLAAVAAIHRASMRLAYESLLPAHFFEENSTGRSKAIWRERLAGVPKMHLYVAMLDDTIAGFIAFGPSPRL